MSNGFPEQFAALTGHPPLSWQTRLYDNHFANHDLPPVIDIPTGLGKTMVMAIWLIAREKLQIKIPTRLIYVVDRRTVVDQATDLATKLRDNYGKDKLAISTLRGQLADNREWSANPSRPAIIIGTVDLIGSALLFSGYRSSYKRRPLEAGLLGQDSLLILDEAHLSKPFEKLIGAIGCDGRFQKDTGGQPHGNPMRVIRMSATSATDSTTGEFRLQGDFEMRTGDFADTTVRDRYKATKHLTIETLSGKEKLTDRLAAEAISLAEDNSLCGKRIVVFVRKPEDAKAVATAIREYVTKSVDESGRRPKKVKDTPYQNSVEVLTGTMRGLERDKLVEKPVVERFLDGDETPGEIDNPVFLISTSAGEVGIDLNADHLVGDAATLDSWIQRLGRVNRRGKGDAIVILVKESKPADKTDFDKACIATCNLLTDGIDVSPKALAAFKQRLTPKEIDQASSPKPSMVDLTDILLDGWSMTSILEPMPGRPEVGPWLRGIDKEQAQTTIAWRAELDLFRDDPTPETALQAIFIKHPIRPHESLTVNTGYLLEFFKRIPKLKDFPPDLTSTRVAVRFPRGQIVWRTLQHLSDQPGILYADSTLILPAKFGGLDTSGMLDADAEQPSLDVADHAGYEQTDEARSRLRILIENGDDGKWSAKRLHDDIPIPDDVAAKLESSYDKTTSLFNDLKRADLRIRLVQPIRLDEEGDPVASLVILAPAPKKKGNEDQSLMDHVSAVECYVKLIADALGLQGPFWEALLFAAKWHDEGKKARVWQFFANNPDPHAPPLGKMAQSRDPKSLRGYRHEFGSLLRIHYPDRCDTIDCTFPEDPDARELAVHLIATHHGAGRPHFGQALYDPFTDAERDAIHVDAIRRFARLQQKYGWWHLAWLENLLRCADQLASADEEVTEIDELEGGEQ